MARAHEEAGLFEPADGASQVRAVGREHLKRVAVDATHPAGDVCRFRRPTRLRRGFDTSPGASRRWKLIDRSQRQPRSGSRFPIADERRQHVADDR